MAKCAVDDFAIFHRKTITPKPYAENYVELLNIDSQEDCKIFCCSPHENDFLLNSGYQIPEKFTCFGAEYQQIDRICYLYQYNPNDIYLKINNESIFYERVWQYDLQRPDPIIVHVDKNIRKTFIEWKEIEHARYYVVESLEPRFGFPMSTIENKFIIDHKAILDNSDRYNYYYDKIADSNSFARFSSYDYGFNPNSKNSQKKADDADLKLHLVVTAYRKTIDTHIVDSMSSHDNNGQTKKSNNLASKSKPGFLLVDLIPDPNRVIPDKKLRKIKGLSAVERGRGIMIRWIRNRSAFGYVVENVKTGEVNKGIMDNVYYFNGPTLFNSVYEFKIYSYSLSGYSSDTETITIVWLDLCDLIFSLSIQ